MKFATLVALLGLTEAVKFFRIFIWVKFKAQVNEGRRKVILS